MTWPLSGSTWLSRPCGSARARGSRAQSRNTASTGSRAKAHQKMTRRLLLVPTGISGPRCGAGWGCRSSRLNSRSRARAEDPARWRGPLTPLVRAGPGDGRTAPDDVDVWRCATWPWLACVAQLADRRPSRPARTAWQLIPAGSSGRRRRGSPSDRHNKGTRTPPRPAWIRS